jgi:hypothetical protein
MHVHGAELLFLNPTAAAAPNFSMRAIANGGTAGCQKPQAIPFLILKHLFLFVAPRPVHNTMAEL